MKFDENKLKFILEAMPPSVCKGTWILSEKEAAGINQAGRVVNALLYDLDEINALEEKVSHLEKREEILLECVNFYAIDAAFSSDEWEVEDIKDIRRRARQALDKLQTLKPEGEDNGI